MKSLLGSLMGVRNLSPVPYAPRSGGGALRMPFLHRSDREVQLRAMSGVGTLFAIVNRQAKAIGGAEWHLYRKAKSGRKEDRVEVTSHAVLDLWSKPNPFFNRQVFAEAGAQHKLLTGEQWWVIARSERAGNLPLELWPVRPDRIEPVPDPEKFLSGYMYYGPGGEQIALRLEDVIFIRTPSPMDPYRGLGPVQSILTDIDATRYSAEWNRNFFLNSAEPGGIVEVPERLSDEEFDELSTRWNEQHKGVANAHRVAFLEHGKWVDRAFSQRDMQFVELRGVSREVIREAYGFPKSMLGTAEDVNRANAEAGEVMFARWLIVPELDAMKAALNQELLPMYGRTAEGLEWDYTSPVPDDVEAEARKLTSRADAAAKLKAAGFHAADVLSAVDLPEMGSVDPDRQLLADIVRGAPTLGPLILRVMGFELPEAEEWSGTPLDQAALAETLSKAVAGGVMTREEARQVLATAGVALDPGAEPPPPPPAAPSPPAPAVEPETVEAMLRGLARNREPGSGGARNIDDGDDQEDADLAAIRDAFETALSGLLARWESDVLPGWYQSVEQQVQQAVDADDAEALAAITLDSGQASGVLRAALATMAAQAAQRVVAEAADQGVTITAPELDEALTAALQWDFRAAFGSELVDIAAATASVLASGLAGSAVREALRLFRPGQSDGATVATRVGRFVRGLSDRFRRDHLGGALHRAQNVARLAAMAEGQRQITGVTFRANERNDDATCDPCSEVDGREMTLAEARDAYAGGGYVECQGGIRCRGTVTADWR